MLTGTGTQSQKAQFGLFLKLFAGQPRSLRSPISIYSPITGVASNGNRHTSPTCTHASSVPIALNTATIAAVSCARLLLLLLLRSRISFDNGASEQMHLSSFVVYPFD